MFCKKCGTQIPDDAVFCPGCGQKVAEEQVPQTPVQPQVQPQVQQPVQQPAPQPSVQQPSVQQPLEKAQGNKMLFVIIGIAAAFLIVAIVFGVLILGKLGDDEDSGKKEDVKTEETSDISTDADVENDSAEVAETESGDSSESEAAAGDDISSYIAERFPKLVEGYAQPKSDNTFWINIDDATRAKLDALDNDYNKVSWIVEYAFRSLPTVVVSFTINENCGVPCVFLAFTNVGEAPVSIDGTADVYDFDNTLLCSGYPYTGMLQPGGTYLCPIACPGADENNIDIGFTALNLDYPSAKFGTYSATAKVGDSTSSNIITSISLANTCENKINMGQVMVLLLDEKGFPVANGYVFSATSTNPGESMDSDLTIGILGEDVDKVKDTAIFASPYITG